MIRATHALLENIQMFLRPTVFNAHREHILHRTSLQTVHSVHTGGRHSEKDHLT